MAAYEVLLLNTAVPQIQAAQAGDTYVVPRDIAFSAALTLSAGTANGVPYLNGSKVLTSGSALTFDGTIFGVSGAGTIYGSVTNTQAGGSARLRLFNTGDTLDGFAIINNEGTSGQVNLLNYKNSPMAFWVNSTEAMRLTSTGLGIGTSSPGYRMEVVSPSGDNITALFRSGDATAANNAGGGFRNISSATAASRQAQIWLDADGANFSGGDYFYIQKNGNSGTVDFVQYSNAAMTFATNNTERARITSGGNFKIGGSADRATTEGDKQLVLFDGTAPVGTLANGISLYSSSGEAYVMDAAGNATLFSPHDAVTNEWIFRSKHTPTGKVLKIDVERLLKFVNDHFGLDAVHEFIED